MLNNSASKPFGGKACPGTKVAVKIGPVAGTSAAAGSMGVRFCMRSILANSNCETGLVEGGCRSPSTGRPFASQREGKPPKERKSGQCMARDDPATYPCSRVAVIGGSSGCPGKPGIMVERKGAWKTGSLGFAEHCRR
jgi:hypothetical protein